MSVYGGFGLRDQESKYNYYVFDLILCLSARVGGTIKNKQPENLKFDSPEFKFLKHVNQLYHKL